MFANTLKRQRPRPGDKWHLGEVFIRIRGELHHLWRVVDQKVLPQQMCRAVSASGSMRARSSSIPARPNIARFVVFKRLIWPSACLLLQSSVTAFRTAFRSAMRVRTNYCKA
jgi:hypothetical protein